MKLTACILFLLPLFFYSGEEKDEWQRLYTWDDSTIDISSSNIIFSTDFTGRVRFRITLSKPEEVAERSNKKYKSIIETIEFRCPERQYRVIEILRFDAKGNMIDLNEAKRLAQWEVVKPGSLMDKFFTPGCEMIYKKKRNP